MKKYVVIFLNQLNIQLSYKFNLITGIISNLISIFLSFFMWKAIYTANGGQVIGGYTENEMLVYIIVVNLLSILFSFEHVVRLGGLIRTGKLSTLLLRPISLLKESFAVFMGQKCIYLVIFAVIYLFSFGSVTTAGDHSLYFIALILFTVLIIVMFFLLISMISTLGFWLIQMWPIRPVLNALYLILGGLYFPLNLFPNSIYKVVQYNPFSLVGYQYSNALQGKLDMNRLWLSCMICLGWAVLFLIIYNLSLAKGLKKYEGMGS